MQRKLGFTILTLFIFLAIVLSACAPAAAPATEAPEPTTVEQVMVTEAPTEEEVTEEVVEEPVAGPVAITDSMGNMVELSALPERIVIAGKATPYTLATTYLFEEASDRVVAQELRGMTTPEFLSLIDPKYDQKEVLEMNAGPEQIAPVES